MPNSRQSFNKGGNGEYAFPLFLYSNLSTYNKDGVLSLDGSVCGFKNMDEPGCLLQHSYLSPSGVKQWIRM